MRYVQPIRSAKQISQIRNMLIGEWNIRDALLLTLGVNSALRASDLLRVTVGDVCDTMWHIRENFEMKERKTGKRSIITITPKVREILELYRDAYPNVVESPNHYLFFAQKSFPQGAKHIGRIQMWKIVNRMAESVGIQESVGCHSLRKSFGYLGRKSGIPIELIQHRLNHSSLVVTRRYLGITDDELADACNKLDL